MNKIKLILIMAALLSITMAAQQVPASPSGVYDVTPGTKGNEITITLLNISSAVNAENVEAKLINSPASINFGSKESNIKSLNPQKETDVTFPFDVERNAAVNTKDTIIFQIKGSNGVFITKQFVLNILAPNEYRLEQNFPNPFNPVTTIQYQVPLESKVSLKVYDILGKEVAVLVNEQQSAGFKEVKFNANNYASGVYIYRFTAEGGAQNYASIKKMLVVK